MDEDKFWLTAIGVVATAVVALVALVNASAAYEAQLVARAVQAGADPIKARCGIAGSSFENRSMCAVATAR